MILEEVDNEIETENAEMNTQESDSEVEDSENESSDKESDLDDGDNENNETENNEILNSGWADSVSKILRTNKPKGKKTLVLSKAKKLSDVRKEKPKVIGFQIDGEIKEEKPDPLELLDKIKEDEDEPLRKKKKELPRVRVKPNVLDRDREKTLAKIATRGVVQLFNAVRDQQKDLQGKLDDAGPLERNKDKVLKSVDKRQFLNVLMGENAKSQNVDEDVKNESSADDEGSDDEATRSNKKQDKKRESKKKGATWGVLREDFMMGAKFKDWDKQIDDEAENST